MANIDRLRVTWEGTAVVGPTISTFYYPAGSASPGAVLNLFTAMQARVPIGVQWTVPNTGDTLDAATGAIVGAWTAAGGGVVGATGATAFTLGVGARIVWETAGIRNKRHVRGSTFIAPMLGAQFGTNGRLSTTVQAAMLTAAGAYLTATSGFAVIWSRPKGGVNGTFSPITSARVPIEPSWLRSRRT